MGHLSGMSSSELSIQYQKLARLTSWIARIRDVKTTTASSDVPVMDGIVDEMADGMVLTTWKVGRSVGRRLVAADLIVQQIDGTNMIVLLGPLGLISTRRIRYQLAVM